MVATRHAVHRSPPPAGRSQTTVPAEGCTASQALGQVRQNVIVPDLVAPAVPAGKLRGQPQPELSVDELTLRPWRPTDVPTVVEAYRDPGIQRWHARSMTRPEAEEWIGSWARQWAAETGASWAVCEGETVLGRVGLRELNLAEGAGAAAYWVLPGARGRSVAARALQTVTQWMFVHVGLHRVELAHSTLNEPSCRVAGKAGFALEGTKRRQALHVDGWHDMHLHARVAGDDQPAMARPA